jgi:hypothetical protein
MRPDVRARDERQRSSIGERDAVVVGEVEAELLAARFDAQAGESPARNG